MRLLVLRPSGPSLPAPRGHPLVLGHKIPKHLGPQAPVKKLPGHVFVSLSLERKPSWLCKVVRAGGRAGPRADGQARSVGRSGGRADGPEDRRADGLEAPRQSQGVPRDPRTSKELPRVDLGRACFLLICFGLDYFRSASVDHMFIGGKYLR